MACVFVNGVWPNEDKGSGSPRVTRAKRQGGCLRLTGQKPSQNLFNADPAAIYPDTPNVSAAMLPGSAE
jgi:hypothetical protein